MKKIKMARGVTLTFEEGCNKYLENCRQRNLREGTNKKVGHIILGLCLCDVSIVFCHTDISIYGNVYINR